jgi:GTP-binding nuclear protein Ran
MQMTTTFKIAIVGHVGCGKTTFLNRFVTGKFEVEHNTTIGVDVSPLFFNVNVLGSGVETVKLNIWDCTGNSQYSGGEESYLVGVKGAIVMFDTTSLASFEEAKRWLKQVKDFDSTIPIVLCGSKSDLQEHRVTPQHDELFQQLQYYDISAKSNYNSDKPFLFLIRKLMDNESITFE